MKVLVALSGGLDSAVVLASLVGEHECHAIGFDYDQPHLIELDRAEEIAAHYKVPFSRNGLPRVPLVNDVVFAGRNLLFAAHLIAWAQADDFDAVALGCNMSDWHRFPDCRPGFWSAVEQAARAYGVKILMPLLHSYKAQVVEAAHKLGVPIHLTWSCYSPQKKWIGDWDIEMKEISEPCGKCLACETRNGAIECAAS